MEKNEEEEEEEEDEGRGKPAVDRRFQTFLWRSCSSARLCTQPLTPSEISSSSLSNCHGHDSELHGDLASFPYLKLGLLKTTTSGENRFDSASLSVDKLKHQSQVVLLTGYASTG